jgi:mannose-1-phosphate guanylyltransferase/mannose-1-phosphate guanylyltransferase/mannose-6-phosphate isomerase
MTTFVHPVVLAGGAGTRLWPVSTESKPKHLLELLGSGTLLERTLARVSDTSVFAQPIIVCAEPQAEEIGALAPVSRLILEPFPKGSAAAIAMAAEALGRDDLLLVLPSDHNIRDPAPLMDAIGLALSSAQSGMLITFGIKPTHAETGYGYIRSGTQISEGVFKAQSFVEKPPQDVAEQLAASGSAYWNSGMFLFSAGALLDELERHAPDIRAATSAAMSGAKQEESLIRPNAEALGRCPATSIDYAVMEHSDCIAVVPIELDWSDVGSWAAVYDLSSRDDHGNVVEDGSRVLGGHGCLIRSTGPRVIAIGVDDLVIVATADHVLVVPRSEAQRVREAASLPDESSR